MLELSLVLLSIHSLIAFYDGVILHIFKFNLHYHQETRFEHLLHSFRALLFSLILIFLFILKPEGVWLYFAILLLALDFVLEIIDIKTEGLSRLKLGGLPNNEYLLHALAITTRVAAISLWLSQFKSQDYIFHLGTLELIKDGYLQNSLIQMFVSSSVVTFFHFYLFFKPVKFQLNKWVSCCEL